MSYDCPDFVSDIWGEFTRRGLVTRETADLCDKAPEHEILSRQVTAIGWALDDWQKQRAEMLAALRMIQNHAKQAQLQPQFAKDQAWEIERLIAAAIARVSP